MAEREWTKYKRVPKSIKQCTCGGGRVFWKGIQRYKRGFDTEWQIECTKCPNKYHHVTRGAAIRGWNDRHSTIIRNDYMVGFCIFHSFFTIHRVVNNSTFPCSPLKYYIKPKWYFKWFPIKRGRITRSNLHKFILIGLSFGKNLCDRDWDFRPLFWLENYKEFKTKRRRKKRQDYLDKHYGGSRKNEEVAMLEARLADG